MHANMYLERQFAQINRLQRFKVARAQNPKNVAPNYGLGYGLSRYMHTHPMASLIGGSVPELMESFVRYGSRFC